VVVVVVVPCEIFVDVLGNFVVTQLKLGDLNIVVFWKGEAL